MATTGARAPRQPWGRGRPDRWVPVGRVGRTADRRDMDGLDAARVGWAPGRAAGRRPSVTSSMAGAAAAAPERGIAAVRAGRGRPCNGGSSRVRTRGCRRSAAWRRASFHRFAVAPTGGIPPVTTFFGEGTPSIDPDAWQLTVTTPTSTRAWTLDALRALGETEFAAVLDCTSGWAIETGWRGVPMATLLDATETKRRSVVNASA